MGYILSTGGHPDANISKKNEKKKMYAPVRIRTHDLPLTL